MNVCRFISIRSLAVANYLVAVIFCRERDRKNRDACLDFLVTCNNILLEGVTDPTVNLHSAMGSTDGEGIERVAVWGV